MDIKTLHEIYYFAPFAAIIHFGIAAVTSAERKERAKFNPVFDERIKSYEVALEDIKLGRYPRSEHEDAKRSAREFYEKYMDKSKPFDFVEYADLQKHYERGIKNLRAARKREMSLLEWMVWGPEVALIANMIPRRDSLLPFADAPMQYVSSELRKDDLVRLGKTRDFARYGIDMGRLIADSEIKGAIAPPATK